MPKKLLLFALLSFSGTIVAQEFLTGRVIGISDGDTVTLLMEDNRKVRVRLYGIDCPERKQAFSAAAKKFTSSKCYGKSVTVRVTGYDRYGRAIAWITLPDGSVLNEELLWAGLAWHYKHFDSSRRLSVLEDGARAAKRGIWALPFPVPPWEFRHNDKTVY